MGERHPFHPLVILSGIIVAVVGTVIAAMIIGEGRFAPATPMPVTLNQNGAVSPPAHKATQIPITLPVPPTISVQATSAPPRTEILPEGVNSASEMPAWLAANVGGTATQWQRFQNGKWRFRAATAGGIGENQILSPRVGYLLFGADSGMKYSNGEVVWNDVSIGPSESTFWKCGEPNKPGSIDSADWTLFNPNVGTSCK
jgi:hypothetical protein